MELIRAAENGDIIRVRELLDLGVDPNFRHEYWRNRYDDSALIVASRYGHTEIVELLLDRGADINIKGKYGWIALTVASNEGRIDIVRLLLNHGADPDIRNDSYPGETALMVAERGGYSDIVRLIQNHIDSDEPSDPDPDLLKDEAARYIQTIMRARIETDKKRKFTKRRYGKWASPKTEREKDRRYMDLIRQIDDDDSMRGYERYSIYPERLLPPKKGGKRNRKYYTRRRY